MIYREWFVRRRFPGHLLSCADGKIPNEWARLPLSALCDSIDYGYTASAESEAVGPKFLRITDIMPGMIDWSTVPHCTISDERYERNRLREGDIVIARTGAIGVGKRITKRHPPAVFASYLVRLRLKASVDDVLVGVFVESDGYREFVSSRGGGAAQLNANARILASAELLVPPTPIQHAFRALVEPFIDQQETLQLQNQNLREARDLLIPRLMSGEVEV